MKAPEEAFLVSDNWNDWFKFSTLFHLSVADANGTVRDIGSIKIGKFGMGQSDWGPSLPESFTQLGEEFFSVGQDDDYYAALNDLEDEVRDQVLQALRDLALDPLLFERALKEEVTTRSLLRSVTESTVRGQFNRMAKGGARLSRYRFGYTAPSPRRAGFHPVSITFSVQPDSTPPTNIHVLIGRNGVGKTFLLGRMTNSLLGVGEPGTWGEFTFKSEQETAFANLVSVSFSAFDEFELIPDRKTLGEEMGYAYVGLKRTINRRTDRRSPKSPRMLQGEFVTSVRECLVGSRRTRWKRAIDSLHSDPVFRDVDVFSLASAASDKELSEQASELYGRLSSGHKIVLLTITRLVELVEEKTLVMIDEPEAHLHPPLLAAYIRALADLLIDRNGVALIATHSPVVMQEVPASCTWILRRIGQHTSAERPTIETFGENIGILSREVFGLELTHSGYHAMLKRTVDSLRDYDQVINEYDNQLGAEARALVRALVSDLTSEK
jgi:predicted ATPase